MRRAEQLHEEILAQMDLSKEASDEGPGIFISVPLYTSP